MSNSSSITHHSSLKRFAPATRTRLMDVVGVKLVHLLEPTHNTRFIAHMDRLMPNWRHHRDELNRLPVPHEDWGY